jgi:hypothetical protein
VTLKNMGTRIEVLSSREGLGKKLAHPYRACAQSRRPDLTFFFAFDVVHLDKVLNFTWRKGLFDLPKVLKRPGPNKNLFTLQWDSLTWFYEGMSLAHVKKLDVSSYICCS